jgi:hypothetical protein
VTREKGKGEGGELVEPVRKCLPWHPTKSARLLGRPATSEPYTILFMAVTTLHVTSSYTDIGEDDDIPL